MGKKVGQGMSTVEWLRESFARERRSRVANGSDLLAYLRDEPISQEDYVGVSFGNRETLTRLLEQGKVKPESEVAYRQALALPPLERPAGGMGNQESSISPEPKAVIGREERSGAGHGAESDRPSRTPGVDDTESSPWSSTGHAEKHGAMGIQRAHFLASGGEGSSLDAKNIRTPLPGEVWNVIRDTARGATQTISSAVEEISSNEKIHTAPGKAVSRAAEALRAGDIPEGVRNAVASAVAEIVANDDLRKKPAEALEKAVHEIMTNPYLHKGVEAGFKMAGAVTKEAVSELAWQLLWSAGPAAARSAKVFSPHLEKLITTGADIGTIQAILKPEMRAQRINDLGRNLKRIASE